MCNYKVLHQSDNGCVVLCRNCQYLQVMHGTTSISLTQEQFYRYKEIIAEYISENSHLSAKQHAIYIPISSPAIQLLYSLRDLKELMEILEDAELGLEVEKLMLND